MTLVEFSLLTVAIASIVVCVSILLVARRLLPAISRFDRFMRRSNRTIRRVDRSARELEQIARDARVLEGRVSRSAHGLLDQVEPVLRAAGALLAGTRTGLGALFSNGGSPNRRSHRHERERSRT